MTKINRTVLHDSVPTVNSFSTGGVVRTKLDLFYNSTGLWSYTGTLPHTVAPNTQPDLTDWKLLTNFGAGQYDLTVNTIQELKRKDVSLGSVVRVVQYSEGITNSEHTRIITDTDDGASVLLDNGYYARVVPESTVSPSWFGAVGDARTPDGALNSNAIDDSQAIQDCIVFAWKNGGLKIVFNSSKSYYTAKTVYVLATAGAPMYPRKHLNRKMQVIDFQGAEFVGSEDITNTSNVFMETGYLSSDGTPTSVFTMTESERYLTAGVILQNVNITSYHTAFRLKNHVFGSTVSDVSCTDVPRVLHTKRCFYLGLRNIMAHGKYLEGVYRYELEDNNNIMPIQSVHTGVCDVGFKFGGATEAITMDNCGIENFKTHGVNLSGGYNIKFNSCYFESNNGIGVVANSTRSITLDTCWVYGNFKMFGGFNDNSNLVVLPNNYIGGGAEWGFSSLPDYNLSDISLGTAILAHNKPATKFPSKRATSINQQVVVYNSAVGVSGVIGKFEQCAGFHPQRVNGRLSGGTGSAGVVGAVFTKEDQGTGKLNAKWETQIEYSDTQLVYMSLKVPTQTGAWVWSGFVVGSVVKPLVPDSTGQEPTVHNIGGFLVVRSPSLSTSIGMAGGEIRLL